MDGSKKPETSVLYAWGFECQSINRASLNLPSQRQSPCLDSTREIIVSRGAKSDILSRLIIREDPLDPFVEFLGKCCQVLWGVELGTTKLLWLRVQ